MDAFRPGGFSPMGIPMTPGAGFLAPGMTLAPGMVGPGVPTPGLGGVDSLFSFDATSHPGLFPVDSTMFSVQLHGEQLEQLYRLMLQNLMTGQASMGAWPYGDPGATGAWGGGGSHYASDAAAAYEAANPDTYSHSTVDLGTLPPPGPVHEGTEAMLERAGSMVGMHEMADTAAINQVTRQSGIDASQTHWCAAWAMNLLEEHGVMDLEGLPNRNLCSSIKSWAQEKGTYEKPDSYQPKPGDAILFDWDKDGSPDHVGIVEKVENGRVHTIEGNSSDRVSRNSYDLGSTKIDGYVRSKDGSAPPRTASTTTSTSGPRASGATSTTPASTSRSAPSSPPRSAPPSKKA